MTTANAVNFSDYKFKWTFRDYQQNALDNSAKYLADKRLHIVAAPGSGKTILGLELIRRLDAPALVLSPSVTIRQQWGERFAEAFMAGIDQIVKAECENLGDGLRMLILTDFIKKEALPVVGTQTELNVMGTVPIFEAVRRAVGEQARIALLAGALVIVPNDIISDIQGDFKAKPLPGAPYSELIFSGSNKNKVAALTQALEAGLLFLLGELRELGLDAFFHGDTTFL
ncbi:MAG: DEAD/DEAH box helicase family protein [Firmicutes bacterium]|nr:DEAD/DEAH box helicase family protein [Bacillota bacterium]